VQLPKSSSSALYFGTSPTVGLYHTRAQLIGVTVNISQMDYNLTLLIGDMDELIRCDAGPGSPDSICFDKSVPTVHDPPNFVDDLVWASGKFGLGTSTEQVPNVN